MCQADFKIYLLVTFKDVNIFPGTYCSFVKYWKMLCVYYTVAPPYPCLHFPRF